MATKQEAVIDAPPQAVARPMNESPLAMFERMASDPSVDVEKFERFMQMRERELARVAEGEFNASMAEAQAEMRAVATDADNPQTRSRYASYKALDGALRPIYTRHGFGMSFNTTDSPMPDHVRVLCDVTHKGGHSKQYRIDMPNDGKGAKGGDVMTKTHAQGAAMSYSMRYLLRMIWNVAVGAEDKDGNQPKEVNVVKPHGFDDWLIDLEATADSGEAVLRKAWSDSVPARRNYLTSTDPDKWEAIKAKSKAVKA